MIRLYYTTTKGQDELQSRFDKSLGGYKSSSLVKSDDFDNFFGEISNYTLNNEDQSQYIGLILKNEDTVNIVVDLNVWFEYPENSYSILEIAAVDLVQDVDGFYYMENVSNIHSSPLYATFYEADGEENKQDLGNIPAGSSIGLWIKRTIQKSIAVSDRENQIVTDPNDEHQVIMTPLTTSDTIEMKMSYT